MKVEVLFNNDVLNKKFSAGWGFSCLVDSCVLFDTGESGKYLFNNIKIMGVDISRIETVVISHDHWDHTGGLWELLKKRKGLKVYACPGFSREFKEKVKKLQGELVEIDKFTKIACSGNTNDFTGQSSGEEIFITGEIAGSYDGQYMPEQALVVKTENGISVITGCAHPGIVKMVEKVKEEFPEEQLYFVFGGFHLMDKDKRAIEVVVEKFKEMDIRKVGPTHCSGKEAEKIFKDTYGNGFISVKAGEVFEI
ncbi:MAG: MBL fold metallo-hydrolase [Candidatus Saelkia tenebricola]|nr:MBL fold metallo-hydrolase [Candidatus Saelkia tenebricola]